PITHIRERRPYGANANRRPSGDQAMGLQRLRHGTRRTTRPSATATATNSESASPRSWRSVSECPSGAQWTSWTCLSKRASLRRPDRRRRRGDAHRPTAAATDDIHPPVAVMLSRKEDPPVGGAGTAAAPGDEQKRSGEYGANEGVPRVQRDANDPRGGKHGS